MAALCSSACGSGASSTTIPGGGPGASSSKLGDFVWYDRNRNGIQDVGELGIAGVGLGLFDQNGLQQTTVSDADGHYAFKNLPAGTYGIEIALNTLPPLAVRTLCNAGTDDALDNDCAPVVVTLLDGATDNTGVDFGFHAELVALHFETEDDCVTPLVNGQDISSREEFGRLVSIDGFPASGLTAAIFDSDPLGPNASSSDPDLLVDLGNVLILQENPGQSVPGIYDLPDDDALGGELRFRFDNAAALLRSIDLIDLRPDPGQDVFVLITDRAGRTRSYSVPSGWTEDIALDGPPGFRTLYMLGLSDQPGFLSVATAQEDLGFDELSVVELCVRLGGSGAVDNLLFSPDLLELALTLRTDR